MMNEKSFAGEACCYITCINNIIGEFGYDKIIEWVCSEILK